MGTHTHTHTQEFDVAKFALPKTPKEIEGETTDYESISENVNRKVSEELRSSKFMLPKNSNRDQSEYEKVDKKFEKISVELAETQDEKKIDSNIEEKQFNSTIEDKQIDST